MLKLKMNRLHDFIKTHLPTAKKEGYLSKSIVTYSDGSKIFVIGSGNAGGIITEHKKGEILKRLNKPGTEVYFFTLFDNKEAFQENSDKISWGSYVWLASDPAHTIHFDNKPELKARYSN
jgi:hypothetical protein